MKKLLQGLHQFRSGVSESEKEMFERLAKRQEPDVLFITCSDSRIVPNLFTGTDPGELFIMRNAGNIIPPYGNLWSGEAASIEFAVTNLKVKDIIVCGHSDCGAVKGLWNPAVAEKMPAVAEWLRYCQSVKKIVDDVYNLGEHEDKFNVAIQENVLIQLEHIRTHPSVAAALVQSSIQLHGWVYKIETNEVFSYHPEAGQFLPVSDTPAHAASKRLVGESV